MPSINPYINFNGNAEQAFNFYRTVFGGEFSELKRFSALQSDSFVVTEEEENKIMHIALPIGSTLLLGNDVPAAMGIVNERENRSKIAIIANSKEEAEQIYAGLSVNAEIEIELAASPWGSYFAMFRDQFGIEWTIDFDPNTVS